MIVLVFLGVMVAAFAFTLGVHLGKRVGVKVPSTATQDAAPVATVPDHVPHKQEIHEQSKNAPQAVDETLNQALHDEVGRTGIKLDSPRQIQLPADPAAENIPVGASANAKDEHKKTAAQGAQGSHNASAGAGAGEDGEALLTRLEAAHRPSPEGPFTLQIGSYPTVKEAKDQVDSMEALGLKPHLRAAQVKGKGKWYRVYLGGFESKEDADKAGNRYRSQHMIETYIVSKNTE